MLFCFWGNIYKSFIGETSGGGELQLALLCKELIKKNHNIIVIDLAIENDLKIETITFISIKKRVSKYKIFKNIFFYYHFFNLLYTNKVNFYGGRMRSSLHIIPIIVSKLNNAKFILWLASDLDTLNFKERYKFFYSKLKNPIKIAKHIIHSELIFKIVLKKSDYIIAQHEIQKQNLNNIKRVYVIPNIVDTQLAKKINCSEKVYDYAIIGSLDKRKGINEIKKLIAQDKDSIFIIVGSARDNIAKDFIKDISSNKNIIYKGQQTHFSTLKIIKQSFALISLSLMEGFPNVFIESWLLGIPVFSLYVDPGDIIKKNNLGYYCNNNFSELIKITSSSKYKEYSPEKLKAYVFENHDPARNINKLLNILLD